MNTMLVEKPGAYSLLQDTGRYGYQRYGVPVNGPMDEWAHRLANALVGNDSQAATLECTLTGPTVVFAQDTLIALTGADMRAKIGTASLPRNRAVMVRHGMRLELNACRAGARGYLAVRGGFSPEPVLGSRSTYQRAGFGGYEGRNLRAGDRVPLGGQPREMLPIGRMLVQSGMNCVVAPELKADVQLCMQQGLRFIQGPQWEQFDERSRRIFESESFVISTQSDRMGYRLSGEPLRLTQPLEMVSEAVTFGTVQVPPGGDPIILMADRQSAGGYPKLAYIISADLPLLAQAIPGTEIRFRAIAQDEGEREFIAMTRRLQDIAVESKKILGVDPAGE